MPGSTPEARGWFGRMLFCGVAGGAFLGSLAYWSLGEWEVLKALGGTLALAYIPAFLWPRWMQPLDLRLLGDRVILNTLLALFAAEVLFFGQVYPFARWPLPVVLGLVGLAIAGEIVPFALTKRAALRAKRARLAALRASAARYRASTRYRAEDAA